MDISEAKQSKYEKMGGGACFVLNRFPITALRLVFYSEHFFVTCTLSSESPDTLECTTMEKERKQS